MELELIEVDLLLQGSGPAGRFADLLETRLPKAASGHEKITK
jgi:hypothetical protein